MTMKGMRSAIMSFIFTRQIDETTNPIEAGLAWTCKLDKEFLGRDSIAKVKEAGPARRIAGLVVTGGVARHGHPIAKDGAIVGVVTSGTFGPTVEKNIALAYVPAELAKVGTEVAARIPRRRPATGVKVPFYARNEVTSLPEGSYASRRSAGLRGYK